MPESKVIADISMSLDGFITGPNAKAGNGLGDGGEVLHYWVFGRRWAYADEEYGDGPVGVDKDVMDEAFEGAGAVIVGRGMFESAGRWGNENPFSVPVFVLSHDVDDELRAKTPTFTWVTDGIDSALAKARAAADGKHVMIGGGADVIRQYLAEGLVDELGIHLAPVVLGGGKRLFDSFATRLELEQTTQATSKFSTHLRYTVIR